MSLESIPVSSFMTRTVKIETEDQNIQAVCKIMNENNIGSIVVVTLRDKAQNPVGIITERDIVRTGRTTKSISSTCANKRINEQTPYHAIT